MLLPDWLVEFAQEIDKADDIVEENQLNIGGFKCEFSVNPCAYLKCIKETSYEEFLIQRKKLKSLKSLAYEKLVCETCRQLAVQKEEMSSDESKEVNERKYNHVHNTYLFLKSIASRFNLETYRLCISDFNIERPEGVAFVLFNDVNYIDILEKIWEHKQKLHVGITIISESCTCDFPCSIAYRTYASKYISTFKRTEK